MPKIDISKLSTIGWGIVGAAFLTLIASFFSFVSASYSNAGISFGSPSSSVSGWTSWWWLPLLAALAVGVVYALTLFGVMKPGQVKPEHLLYGAAASFVLLIIVLINTFSYGTGGYDLPGLSHGPGFGIWFALVTTLALTYFTALAVQSTGGKLPFKVPGPTA